MVFDSERKVVNKFYQRRMYIICVYMHRKIKIWKTDHAQYLKEIMQICTIANDFV